MNIVNQGFPARKSCATPQVRYELLGLTILFVHLLPPQPLPVFSIPHLVQSPLQVVDFGLTSLRIQAARGYVCHLALVPSIGKGARILKQQITDQMSHLDLVPGSKRGLRESCLDNK